MTRTMARRLAWVLAVLVMSLSVRSSAQAPEEMQLLKQIDQNPRIVTPYLDLAKIYYAQRRYPEVEAMLRRGLVQLQQEATLAGPPPFDTLRNGVVPGPTPPRVGAGLGAQQAGPVRVGGNVKAPTKIQDAKPVYPADALAAGVSGLVIIEATIATDGLVKDAKVIRSVPMLDQAALDSVRQWRYTPTLMNGAPMEVIMTVTVNFSTR